MPGADQTCTLFAPDLRYDYRGFPERDYADVCDVLHRSLADPTKHYSYSGDIKEVLTSGDLVLVRVVWTLTITPTGSTTSTQVFEHSMDIFQPQPDGSWKLARFNAYDDE
jgi:hypothetical protein